MADPTMNKNNESMQRQQNPSEKGSDRKGEEGKLDNERKESGIIGSGESKGENKTKQFEQSRSQTGEAGRARSELDQNKSSQQR